MRILRMLIVTAVAVVLLSACAGPNASGSFRRPPDIQQEISAGGTIWGETRANTRGSANSNIVNQ